MDDKNLFENENMNNKIEENLEERNTKSTEENFDSTQRISVEEVEEQKRESSKEKLSKYINTVVNREVDKVVSKNKKKNFAKFMLGVILASTISSGITANYFKHTNRSFKNNKTEQTITINSNENMTAEKAVAKKSTNSVVGITTVGVSEDIFNRQSQYQGIGSGVIVSKYGYIITNNHVVDPSSTRETTVLLNDGTKFLAEVLWADKILDLAIIKIDPKDVELEPVEIGDSSTIEVGDKAIAIGSPLDINLQSTLTSGYISGKDRTITLKDGSVMEGLFQTDASINPGNSGGALLNTKGELIAINTAKAGGSDGIGFAIPINVAKPILNQIIKNGKFEMVVLGIKGIDVARYNALKEIPLKAEKGVYVHEAIVDYPAYESGIRSGDIITKIGETEINSNTNIKTALLNYQQGDSTTVEILRDGKKMEIKVTFAKSN